MEHAPEIQALRKGFGWIVPLTSGKVARSCLVAPTTISKGLQILFCSPFLVVAKLFSEN